MAAKRILKFDILSFFLSGDMIEKGNFFVIVFLAIQRRLEIKRKEIKERKPFRSVGTLVDATDEANGKLNCIKF